MGDTLDAAPHSGLAGRIGSPSPVRILHGGGQRTVTSGRRDARPFEELSHHPGRLRAATRFQWLSAP